MHFSKLMLTSCDGVLLLYIHPWLYYTIMMGAAVQVSLSNTKLGRNDGQRASMSKLLFRLQIIEDQISKLSCLIRNRARTFPHREDLFLLFRRSVVSVMLYPNLVKDIPSYIYSQPQESFSNLAHQSTDFITCMWIMLTQETFVIL